jgi:hypothetical protein
MREDKLPEAEVREKLRRGHLRLALGHLADTLREARPNWTQGNLDLYWVDEKAPALVCAAQDFFPYSQVVFNHYLARGGVVARWNEWFIVHVKGPILAMNHEPLKVPPGWYVAHHPVPDVSRDVD